MTDIPQDIDGRSGTAPSGSAMTRYTELELSSALLDQPAATGAPRKLIVCATPRSGSYLLCRHLIHAGLGVPHEYFNPVVIHQMAPRLGLAREVAGLQFLPRGRRDRLLLRRAARAAEAAFMPAYIAALRQRRCLGGVFAAKIHYRDFVRVLDNPVGHKLLDGAVFVFLYRDDMLKQAVSERFGQLTGRWGIDSEVTTAPAANPDFFDVAAIDRALDDLAEQERGWRLFLARRGAVPVSVSYEKLCEAPFAFVTRIADRLGVERDLLRTGYSEAGLTPARDAALPDKADIARHYLASRQTGGGPATS